MVANMCEPPVRRRAALVPIGIRSEQAVIVVFRGKGPGAVRKNPRHREKVPGSSCRAEEAVGDPKLAQHRGLLALMRLHAREDVVERASGAEDVRTLVEHYALGLLAHRSIAKHVPRPTGMNAALRVGNGPQRHVDRGMFRRAAKFSAGQGPKTMVNTTLLIVDDEELVR